MLETGPFPYLTIDSVTLTKNKVKVRAFLTTQQEGYEPFWLNEDVFSSFVKIYFVLIDRKMIDQHHRPRPLINPSTLQSPSNRARAVLLRNRSGPLPDLASWDTIITNNYPHKIITLKDAVEAYENNIVVTPTLDMNSNNLSDIFFDIEIDNFSYEITPDLRGMEKMELVAFTHLDLVNLTEEYNLNLDPTVKAELIQTGGNMTYDLLLDKNEQGKLFTPRTRRILTLQDGTPYTGEYHKHTTQNPGPGGYIGFMAGAENHPNMANMPRLKTTYVPNNKIVARYFIDDSEFNSGYFGGPIRNMLEDEGSFGAGIYPNYELFTANKISMADENAMLRAETADVINEFYQNPDNTPGAKIVADTKSWITIPAEADLKSYYGIKFSLDFRSLVKSNSRYGSFIDLVRQNGPVVVDGEEVTEETLLSLTRISSMKVHRRRVSNSPRSNNPMGTADYDRYSNEDPDRFLVQSEDIKTDDVFRKTLLNASNPPRRRRRNASLLSRLGIITVESITSPGSPDKVADISEIPLAVDPNDPASTFKRTFLVRDYELFEKINFGYYTYIVEITLEDRIKNFLIEKIARFEKLMSDYKLFLADASKIYTGGKRYFGADTRRFIEPIEREDSIDLEKGNYIYESGKFTDNFKNNLSPASYDAKTKTLVGMFDSLSRLVFQTDSRVEEIEQNIIPIKGGNLEEAQLFEKNCQELLNLYYTFLRRDNTQQIGSLPRNSVDYIYETKAKNSSDRQPQTVTVSQDLKTIVKSFIDGELMVSYGLDGSDDSAQTILAGIEQTRRLQEELIETVQGLGETLQSLRVDNNIQQIPTQTQETPRAPGPNIATQLESGMPLVDTGTPTLQEIIPKEFMTAAKGLTRSLMKSVDFISLSQVDKIRSSMFINQIQQTDPSKTEMELEKGIPDIAVSSTSTGLSLGIPNIGTGISKILPTNTVKTKSGDLQSGLIPESIEKSMINLDVKISGAKILDKQNLAIQKEKMKIMQDPRIEKAAQLAKSITTTAAANGATSAKPQELFLAKVRNVEISGMTSTTTKKKRNVLSKKTSMSKISEAVKSIKEVVEVSVSKSTEKEKTVQVNDVAFVETKKVNTISSNTVQSTGPATSENSRRRSRRSTRRVSTTTRGRY